jgi:hypothetical protein
VDYTFALPDLPFVPRPPGLMPQTAMFSDMTLVRTLFAVPSAATGRTPGERDLTTGFPEVH